MRFLIVDDEPLQIDRMAKLLQLTYPESNIYKAQDGEQAWNMICENGPYDIIITDNQMPNLSGLDLIKIIRANERQAGSRPLIVLISGDADPHQAEKLGADRAFEKPIVFDSLLEVINGHYESVKNGATNEAAPTFAPGL